MPRRFRRTHRSPPNEKITSTTARSDNDYTISLNLSKSFEGENTSITGRSCNSADVRQPDSTGRTQPTSRTGLPQANQHNMANDGSRMSGNATARKVPTPTRSTDVLSPTRDLSSSFAKNQTSSRRGKNHYTTEVMWPLSPNVPSTVAPMIRRRRRIGRPFLTGSPLMWNEEYLSTPVNTLDDEFVNDQEKEVDDSNDSILGTDYLAFPSLGGDGGADDAKLWNQSNELRRRWRAANDAMNENSQDASSSANNNKSFVEQQQRYAKIEKKNKKATGIMSFSAFRINYLVVHIAIMLADGLQGTHLYVLYEGYGYSVASLYSLGFVSGAITSPFIGPLVDKLGRKRAAMLYCSLEMFINWLEQFPYFYGLIVSRVIGGVTTNLLFSVFESWLVTEHRRRGYAEKKLETILRDSVILSNIAAIASGFLAELLAVRLGPVGPFEGAVVCTAIALVLVTTMWRENYGSDVPGGVVSMRGYMKGAFKTIVRDTNISRIGVIQGLTEGSLQTFVFLWSPALARFAPSAPPTALGLDGNHEPAYGHIFGAFMACGVAGGLAEPYVRRAATYLVRDHDRRSGLVRGDTIIVEGEGEVKPAAVEFMTTGVYMACTCLLLVPFLVPADGEYSFSVSLGAFLLYEFMVGLYMPCEGVIRSIYMPTSSVCSVMTMLRVIVNIAVAVGVISTNYVTFRMAFAAVSSLMLISSAVQLSMVDGREWKNFVLRVSVTSVVSVEEKDDGAKEEAVNESRLVISTQLEGIHEELPKRLPRLEIFPGHHSHNE